MIVTTESGTKYHLEVVEKGLLYTVLGDPARVETGICIGIYPNRMPFLKATVRMEKDGRFHVGYNAKGVRTLRFDPAKVLKGMYLVNNRTGLHSTAIVNVA